MMYSLGVEGWLDAGNSYGWTCLMQATEQNKSDHVAALLRAGADKTVASTVEYGLFPAGSTAVSIANLMVARLGVNRKDIIELLEFEPPSLKASHTFSIARNLYDSSKYLTRSSVAEDRGEDRARGADARVRRFSAEPSLKHRLRRADAPSSGSRTGAARGRASP